MYADVNIWIRCTPIDGYNDLPLEPKDFYFAVIIMREIFGTG